MSAVLIDITISHRSIGTLCRSCMKSKGERDEKGKEKNVLLIKTFVRRYHHRNNDPAPELYSAHTRIVISHTHHLQYEAQSRKYEIDLKAPSQSRCSSYNAAWRSPFPTVQYNHFHRKICQCYSNLIKFCL